MLFFILHLVTLFYMVLKVILFENIPQVKFFFFLFVPWLNLKWTKLLNCNPGSELGISA